MSMILCDGYNTYVFTIFCDYRYTYEVSPVFTLMEREVYAKMLSFIDFNDGDAIFAPGKQPLTYQT